VFNRVSSVLEELEDNLQGFWGSIPCHFKISITKTTKRTVIPLID
jgi:hypothetical protein